MVDLAIDLRDVAKTYRRRVQALRGIQMQVQAGEIFGLLGPNGAGKSTLVKIMTTVVRPNRAEGTILGRPIGHKGALARVGYLPEHLRFPPYLTGRQILEFFAALAKVDRPTRKRRAAELLDTVNLKAWANVKIGTYSKGMQQRIGLAQALVGDPDLVILDEPTEGLDPVGRREIREVLGRLRDQGKTVFLNSHLLSEVERICDRVAILLAGKVVRQGTLDELTAGSEYFEIQLFGKPDPSMREAMRAVLPCELAISLTAGDTISAHKETAPALSGKNEDRLLPATDSPSHAAPLQKGEGGVADEKLPREVGRLPTGEAVELDGNTLRIATGDPLRIQSFLDGLRSRGQVICAVRRLRQSLEDFFVQIVSEPSSPAPSPTTQTQKGRQ